VSILLAGKSRWGLALGFAAIVLILEAAALAQATQTGQPANSGKAIAPAAPVGVTTPADYVIGPDDVLTIVFWREKDMSTDAAVRPDGKISLPLLNDVEAAGLTPEQLRERITAAASKLFEEPTVAVVVKAINSRKVFITGQVSKPGAYSLTAPTTVVQLIAMAGGVLEYADSKNISVVRTENGRVVSFRVNYKDLSRRKNLNQNIELKPGDTVIVP
jgi:polysaccharide export outer membrane protein